MTVRALDIRQDTLHDGGYDLVHSRLLLIHMADPVEVLTRMAAGLRPSGVLWAEESDVGLVTPSDIPTQTAPTISKAA